jgi:hypothetical protein
MEESLSSKANSHSTNQIPVFSGTPRFQIHPFHTFPAFFPKIHFNIIFPSRPRSLCGLLIP